MNQTAVTDCLSQAIVDVAEREFNRLRNGMSDVEVAQAVEGALRSFGGLRSGIMPDYDEWDAPFYLTWYHPNHVNLAYSMIAATLKTAKMESSEDLYVLDFGCGTLATQFGLALAVADLRDEQMVESIRVRPIDDSKPMVRLGMEVWDVFGELARKYPELGRLSAVIDSMRIEFDDSLPELGEERWLSAMHVVYPQNSDHVKARLAFYEKRIKPDVGFITCHQDNDSQRRAVSVSPFESAQYRLHQQLLTGFPPIFNGGLPKITQWRWQVKAGILNPLPAEAASNLPLITDKCYLDRPVSWNWASAACRVYTRIE